MFWQDGVTGHAARTNSFRTPHMRITRLWLAALGLGAFAWATPAHAEGFALPPFKVHFSVRFRVTSTEHPAPTAPWWAYFPQGGHDMAPASGTTVYPQDRKSAGRVREDDGVWG